MYASVFLYASLAMTSFHVSVSVSVFKRVGESSLAKRCLVKCFYFMEDEHLKLFISSNAEAVQIHGMNVPYMNVTICTHSAI